MREFRWEIKLSHDSKTYLSQGLYLASSCTPNLLLFDVFICYTCTLASYWRNDYELVQLHVYCMRGKSYVYEKNGFFSRTYSPIVEISESSRYEEGEWEERANVRSHPNPTCYPTTAIQNNSHACFEQGLFLLLQAFTSALIIFFAYRTKSKAKTRCGSKIVRRFSRQESGKTEERWGLNF